MRDDFPIFQTTPDIVYLDSAATAQKPAYVLEKTDHYLRTSYANIHRGSYAIAEASEELYRTARKKVASRIHAQPEEVVFTSSSTDSVNRLVRSLQSSKWIQQDDVILVGEGEHHANLVPWFQLAERTGCKTKIIPVTKTGCLDRQAFLNLLERYEVRLVALHYVSNVTGTIEEVKWFREQLSDDALLILDASQAIPHIPVDVQQLGCDFLFFTGHKLGAFTGIGVLRGKKKHLEKLHPGVGGGAAIRDVALNSYTLEASPDKFEPGTPNLVGAASLLYALEYIESIGGYDTITTLENKLMQIADEYFAPMVTSGLITPLWSSEACRVGVYSFVCQHRQSPVQLAQRMAIRNICIRCGGQCAHPLHQALHAGAGSCRISFRLYTTEDEITVFFQALEEFLRHRF